MSYAEAAAHNSNQSAEQARAPNPGTVKSDASSSLVDVDSPHVSTVPPQFEDQSVRTDTQAERLEREEEEAEEGGGEGGRSRREKGKQRAKDAEEKAKAMAGRGKDEASGCFAKLQRNKSNPVVLVNTLLLAAAAGGLGYGAYQRRLKGLLSWDLLGMWGGGVAAAGTVDYFVSKWFLQNKYPPK